MTDQDWKDKGLLRRYDVRKADGSPVDANAEYFVLRIDRQEDCMGPGTDLALCPPHDPHAHAALAAYADSVEAENPAFAGDLRYWLDNGLQGFTRDARIEMGFEESPDYQEYLDSWGDRDAPEDP